MLERALRFKLHHSPRGKRHYTWLGLTVNSSFTRTRRKTRCWRPPRLAVLILPVFFRNELCLWHVNKLSANEESPSADTSSESTSHGKCIPKSVSPSVMSQRALLACWFCSQVITVPPLFCFFQRLVPYKGFLPLTINTGLNMLLPENATSAVRFFSF